MMYSRRVLELAAVITPCLAALVVTEGCSSDDAREFGAKGGAPAVSAGAGGAPTHTGGVIGQGGAPVNGSAGSIAAGSAAGSGQGSFAGSGSTGAGGSG